MKPEFDPIKIFLQKSVGFDISSYDEYFLFQVFQNRRTETKTSTSHEYYELLKNDKFELAGLLHELQNSYSEFFRNTLTFSVLEKMILPGLLFKKDGENNVETRIWSAACASGQEVYSLAMLIEDLNEQSRDTINYRIFASDKLQLQIDIAKEGLYNESQLGNVKSRQIKKWFKKSANNYRVKPEIQMHVDFSVFDLFCQGLCCPASSIFGDFDIVFCANILFYYNEESRQEILYKASKCLKNDGYLIVGEAEREILLSKNFYEVFPMSCVFRKVLSYENS